MASRSNKSDSGMHAENPRLEAAKERGRVKRKKARVKRRSFTKSQKLVDEGSTGGLLRDTISERARKIKTALGR